MTRKLISPAAAQTPHSVYVHVPFCLRRCGYCNFTLVAGRDDLIGDYLAAIEREMETVAAPHQVDTIFYGGGTPTHLPTPHLEQLLKLTIDRFPPAEGYEWSVEANPADLSDEKLDLLAQYGVNRISLGVQSFRDAKLELLERDHRAADAIDAAQRVRAKFDRLAIDLIFAAPGETVDMWRDDVRQAIDLGADHLSTYGLTFEKGTTFWNRLLHDDLEEVDEEVQREQYLAGIEMASAAGFEHYEVSNFARPDCRCAHNENYWLGGGYYAFGPGAARYVGGRRETNHRSTTRYIQKMLSGESAVAEAEELTPEELARERLIFGMRRLEGIDPTDFAAATGFEVDQLAAQPMHDLESHGLIERISERIRLTRAGLLVSDSIWPELL
ncbi:radical SAM family heme chaperone HemW [Blastopirellula retiformator]|uniref:Heme chaperone HemW n=1 Tax=Blastopirellula retiformator TaxID=2527970 RepID=A0A5C5VKH6_9BACT|nr:radical SAM family heme chaperone HemW [Blastopirellula retiformator]TWT38389.1 Oxygen-independent coproporphyrinogen-III oxidase-like protein [Blastopirellula retiformator]